MQTELNKVITALTDFYGCETYLFANDLGERTLTHRLAVHLEKQFAGWEVDCDYDRLGERTLRLPHGTIVSTDDHLAKSIYPDIVVHQRKIPNNLLAIELRKASNHQPPEHDQHKLRALTEDRKSTRLNSSHSQTSYAVFCLKKKNKTGPTRLSDRATHASKGLLERAWPAAST